LGGSVSRAPRTVARAFRRVLLAVLLGVLVAPAASHGAPAPDNLLNKKAPGFVLTDLSGQSLTLARFRGKVVLLNFWATWCAPCQVEMPVFAAWQRQYGAQGLQVIGISMDDDAAVARKL